LPPGWRPGVEQFIRNGELAQWLRPEAVALSLDAAHLASDPAARRQSEAMVAFDAITYNKGRR
jgi:hypothetical protein